MNLKIDNFAKIEHADIQIDGITVIAGENNTGKSTVGKILFSSFNSMCSIEDEIFKRRKKEIENICIWLFNSFANDDRVPREFVINIANTISNDIYSGIKDREQLLRSDILTILKREVYKYVFYNQDEEIIDEFADKILAVLNLPAQAIKSEVITRYFNSVFYNQINSFNNENKNANLELKIKNKCIKLVFSNNECTEYSSDISILNKAVYIDNPFIVDTLSNKSELNIVQDYLKSLLLKSNKADIMDGIIESVLAKEKLNEVYQAIQNVVGGQIIEKPDNFYLQNDGVSQPVKFNNISAGLKSFVIIKMLLEKGALKEKDVLILDEPEIHLHPQWQVAFAELIVLLQKSFDLSIIITTHSPYFLDAINLFSVKHGVNKKVNYYLSSIENNNANIELVTDNIELIYKKMASPVEVLDTLRYQLNNE